MARPAVKKQEIEQAAIRLFALNGLAGTTIKDIAAAANVTEGALYRHYPSKNEMAWKLYCREVDRLSHAIEAGVSSASGTLRDRMLTGVRFFYSYYRENPDNLTFVLFTRQSFPMHQLSDENIDPDVVIVKFLQSLLSCAPAHKVDPASMPLILAMVRGAVCEPLLMHRYGKITTWPDELIEPVADACVRILTTGGAA